MIGPMIPEEYTNLIKGKVKLENFVQLGANSIVMPGILINEGAVTGAFTFVNRDLEHWTINAGIPVKRIKERKKEILNLYKKVDGKEEK